MRDDHARLEAELRDLQQQLDAQLAEHDLSVAVLERVAPQRTRDLRALGPPTRAAAPERTRWSRRPRARVLALVAALLAVSVLAIPPARAAIVRALHIGAEELHREPPPPNRATVPPRSAGAPLPDLGRQATLPWVAQRMEVAVPSLPELATPDEVWFASTPGGRASFIYYASDALPAAANTINVGLLIQEFGGDGTTAVDKYLMSDTDVEPVTVGRVKGAFLTGTSHAVWYDTPDGGEYNEVGRLAGNALIFQRGALTIRLEGDLSRDQMVAIARSLHEPR
jgi:hypothetical protein